MSSVQKLGLRELQDAVTGSAAAFRCRRRLQPAGGKGDKVFPPTYEGAQYATEDRVVNEEGKPVRVSCVLLDSVQSQANRMELALLEATREQKIQVPLVEVDFGKANLPEVGKITSLEAPHRLADAILRDSVLDGKKFRETEDGKTLDSASVANATGLFGLCPTALVFGLWDSTGPRGGLGTKFQRVLVSEIVGIMCVSGVKPSSRIDPLGIELSAGPLYRTGDGSWTPNPEEAAKGVDGQPEKLGKEGKPSEANHGNVTPSLKDKNGRPHHGGVTLDHVLQTVVISLPAIRRLRFPVQRKNESETDPVARTCIAALGLCAAALSISKGCDLRSRCLLVPEPGQASWELINGDGTVLAFDLTACEACKLLEDTVATAVAAGLPWRKEALVLTPSDGLAALVRKSREIAMQTTESE